MDRLSELLGQAVQFIYTIALAQSGILIARRDDGELLSSIQLVSFIVWLGISLIAAVVIHRLASALGVAAAILPFLTLTIAYSFLVSAHFALPKNPAREA